MPLIVKETAKDIGSGHWYDHEGKAVHQVEKSSGDGMRSTTLRDARKLNLLPSVTGILQVMSKDGLMRWKLREAVKAASGRIVEDDYAADRIIAESMEQVEEAANLGSRVHDALENYQQTGTVPVDVGAYAIPVISWMDSLDITITYREKIVANTDHGYAGMSDVFFRWGPSGNPGILDYKSRKTKPGQEVRAYDGQAMQLAAYAAAEYGEEALPQVLAANVYFSTTEPGRMDIVKYWDEDAGVSELPRHWEGFKACLALWRYLKNFDPRTTAEIQGQSAVQTTIERKP